jgi:hypothetical protein
MWSGVAPLGIVGKLLDALAHGGNQNVYVSPN